MVRVLQPPQVPLSLTSMARQASVLPAEQGGLVLSPRSQRAPPTAAPSPPSTSYTHLDVSTEYTLGCSRAHAARLNIPISITFRYVIASAYSSCQSSVLAYGCMLTLYTQCKMKPTWVQYCYFWAPRTLVPWDWLFAAQPCDSTCSICEVGCFMFRQFTVAITMLCAATLCMHRSLKVCLFVCAGCK